MKDDTISRAAAIDAMMKLQAEDIEAYGASIPEGFDGDRAAKALKELPPAQPDMETLMNLALMMAEPIEFLDLSVRSYNALKRWGITTVAQVCQTKRDGKLNKIRNLGEKSVYEIEHCLNQYLSRWKGGTG